MNTVRKVYERHKFFKINLCKVLESHCQYVFNNYFIIETVNFSCYGWSSSQVTINPYFFYTLNMLLMKQFPLDAPKTN